MGRVPKLSFAQGQLLLWILGGSFVAFGAMFVFFHFSGVSLSTTPRESQRVLLMPAPSQNAFSHSDARYVIADLFDPSLMTLPSAHGFSRDMWRQKIDARQRELGWEDSPAFLSNRPMEALRSLLEPAPVEAAVLSSAEKTVALSTESNDSEILEMGVSVNQSVLRVVNSLGDRALTFAPPLPVIRSSGSLRPTQVHVGVAADGQVLYALVDADQSSGDDAVDNQALALARQIRFEAARDASSPAISWAVVRFLWALQPPAPANDVAVSPGSAAE